MNLVVILNSIKYNAPCLSTYQHQERYNAIMPFLNTDGEPWRAQANGYSGTAPEFKFVENVGSSTGWGTVNDGWDSFVISYDNINGYVGVKINGVVVGSSIWSTPPSFDGVSADVMVADNNDLNGYPTTKMRNIAISTFDTVDWDISHEFGTYVAWG